MQSSWICVGTLKTRGTGAQGERKSLLRVKTIMRSSLPSFSSLLWINHNPQVPQWLFPVTKYYKTVWGQRADGVWGGFLHLLLISKCLLTLCFGEPSECSICAALKSGQCHKCYHRCESLDSFYPFWTPQHNFCSSCWSNLLLLSPELPVLLWIGSSRNFSRAMPSISSPGGLSALPWGGPNLWNELTFLPCQTDCKA